MRGLYAIVDVSTVQEHGLDVLRFAEAVLSARPTAVQLRDKRGEPRATLALLRALQLLARQAGVPLLANDRADLAALAGCDGIHLGRQDLPAPLARRVLHAAGRYDALVGLSAHNQAELEASLAEQPDYLAFGPVFATIHKAAADPVIGLDGLAALVAHAQVQAAPLPCVAIGGISLANAAEVAARCPCAAVIGGLLPLDGRGEARYREIAERARALQQALTSARH